MVRRPVYRFHELELDPSGQCLRRSGADVHLRPKVFDVLYFLVENRGRIVSRTELLDRFWPGVAVTDDVVFRCIAELRTVLEDDRRSPRFLKTVSKAGYRFVAPVEELGDDPPLEELSATPLEPPVEPEVERPPAPRRTPFGRAAFLAAALAAPCVLYLGAFRSDGKRVDVSQEVGWWRFDEGAGERVRDVTGNGNDGKIVGQAGWIEGRRGKALRFAEGRGHVEGEDFHRAFPRGSAARTVSTWMRTAGSSPEDVSLLYYGRPGQPLTRRFSLFLEETGKAALGTGSEYAAALRGLTKLTDGDWHLVTAVYEGESTNTARLYVDGALEGNGRLEDIPQTADDPKWTLGGSYYSATRFRGDLDDMRLYARALRTAEVEALYRCSMDAADVALPDGKPGYFFPVFGDQLREPVVKILRSENAGTASVVRHIAKDYAGVQFARAEGECAMAALRGADIGQDISIGADLLVPRGEGDSISYAGPYFRNRRAAPGDGIIGGTSAGYWVVLDSNGMVRVRLLSMHEVVAHSAPVPRFDDKRFHRLEIAVRGQELQVTLDGAAVAFEQNGRRTATVVVPPVWETAAQPGKNAGTAGVAFGSHPRNSVGGQEARNLQVSAVTGDTGRAIISR